MQTDDIKCLDGDILRFSGPTDTPGREGCTESCCAEHVQTAVNILDVPRSSALVSNDRSRQSTGAFLSGDKASISSENDACSNSCCGSEPGSEAKKVNAASDDAVDSDNGCAKFCCGISPESSSEKVKLELSSDKNEFIGCNCCSAAEQEDKISVKASEISCAMQCCNGQVDAQTPADDAADDCHCCNESAAMKCNDQLVEVSCPGACCGLTPAPEAFSADSPNLGDSVRSPHSGETVPSDLRPIQERICRDGASVAVEYKNNNADKLGCPCCMEKRNSTLLPVVSDGSPSTVFGSALGRVICCQAPCCQPPGSVSMRSVFISMARRFLRSTLRRSQQEAIARCRGCDPDEVPFEKPIPNTENSLQAQTLVLTIGGMDCPACTPRVERALRKLDQVTDIKVDYVSAIASCSYNPSKVSPDEITQHVSLLTGFVCRRRLGSSSEDRTLSVRFLQERIPSQLQLRRIFGVDDNDKENRVFVHAEDPAIITFRLKASDPPGSARGVLHRFGGAGHPCEAIFIDENELTRKRSWDAVLLALLRATLSSVCLIPTLVLVWEPHILSDNALAKESIVLGLASIILILASPIFLGAYRTVFIARHLDADVLITLSTLSAYIYSVVVFALTTASKRKIELESYFETSSLLVTLILIARVVSAFVRWLALSSYLSHVIGNDLPTHVEWVDPSSALSLRKIHASLLDAGDTIILALGDVVPSDGTLDHGNAFFDEALITGEANPVSKVPGSALVAGSRLLSWIPRDSVAPEDDNIRVTLTRAPHESSLVELRRIVSEARSSRPAVQDMADALASRLVPCILIAAVILLVIWTLVEVLVRGSSSGRGFSQALTYMIALLASSCPCALTLCVPLVYCVAVAKVAIGGGILVKDANAFIGAGRVTDVVFDKTGTLTTGKLSVVDKAILPFTANNSIHIDKSLSRRNLDPTDVEALVLALVLDDTHPVSSGVCSYLLSLPNHGDQCQPQTLQEKKSIPGQGISALWNEIVEIKGGHLAFCLDSGSTTRKQSLHPDIARVVSSGKTIFVVALNSQVVAAYALQDSTKSDAHYVVSTLRERGARVSILSGDNDEATWEVGKELGFSREDVRGGCEPRIKRDIVRKLAWKDDCEQEKEDGTADESSSRTSTTNILSAILGSFKIFRSQASKKRFVVFVGDGSNDAGVLSQADLGISFQSGTNLANAAADVILLTSPSGESDLQKVLAVIELSESTKRRIVACFVWAVMYNFIAFVISSGILVVWRLEPQWAGVGELASLAPVFLIAFAPRRKLVAG